MRILVVTAEPISAEMLREAIGSEETDAAEVLVVTPALHQSGLRFWMSDADSAIAKAEDAQQESVERLEEEGIDAAGDTGESDPLTAMQDTLATFEADQIVVFSHPDGERDYSEKVGEAEQRFGLPVVHRTVGRSETDQSESSGDYPVDRPATPSSKEDDADPPEHERLENADR